MKTSISFALTFVMTAASALAQTPVGTSGAGTAAAASRPASTTGAAAATPDYRLVAGDKLRIDVYEDKNLSQQLQIRPDGKITMPLVGDVVAAGRSAGELRDSITASLKEHIAAPTVTVIVTETMPQMVYVTGEVHKPGGFTIAGQMSILQAIAMAGGLTEFANKKDIRVQRISASGMQILKFNYKDALDEDNRREPLQLLPGDTVIVK
jgi:polysaccharide export outer membrane protein